MGLMDAIGQVGEGIDKFTGGRAIRGLAAGKPRELASILPFSDSAGITREEDKTSGRDLTDAYGLTNRGDNSFHAHAAGFLADNVLSPANWLSGAAAFKAAPTIGKGITQGAKALSGLDIFDHLASGARGLKNLATGDAGSMKLPGGAKNPIGDPTPMFYKYDPETHDAVSDLAEKFTGGLRQFNTPAPHSEDIASGARDMVRRLRTTMTSMGRDSHAASLSYENIPFSNLTLRGDQRYGSEGLAEVIKNGGELPPISVGRTEGGGLHVLDGHHRARAYDMAGKPVPSFVGQVSPAHKDLAGLINFFKDDSGYLRHAIPGVPEELANAMDGLGPQYPGGVGKLRQIAEQATGNTSGNSDPEAIRELSYRLGIMMKGPHAEGIASEIPEGSRFLGAGAEGIALRTPDGSVIRIGDHPNQANRPEIPEMLQAYREHKVGRYKIEHMPEVASPYNEFTSSLKSAGQNGADESELMDAVLAHGRMNDLQEGAAAHVRGSVSARGYTPWDASAWNLGMTPEGNAIIFDGGAVHGEDLGRGYRAIPGKPTYENPTGDMLQQVLAAGGPEKVRESLRMGQHMGTVGQGIHTPQMPQLMNEREAIQDFLSMHGIHPGMRAGWRSDTPMSALPALEASTPAPSLGKLAGVGALGLGGGGLLAALYANQGQ